MSIIKKDKSKRIAVVLGCNIHWAPYYYKYEQILNENNCEFDVILWNRENINENIKENLIQFNMADISNNHNPRKVFKFFAFAKFVKKVIKNGDYEKIIFLGLQGCSLPLNASFFSKHFKDKYWLDIRDYHYEWFKPYYLLEKRVINDSYYTVISSKGFERFLPAHEYGHIHNIDPMMKSILANYNHVNSDVIRISFVGNVRYFDENVAILKHLGNDGRFCLQYFGPGIEKIKTYCNENNIKNVKFEGAFPRERTQHLYEITDIINNVYGNYLTETQTALSNKLYYAIYLKMPILVSSNTYMEEVSRQYGFSYSFTDNENFADGLYNWYMKIKMKEAIPDFKGIRDLVESEESMTKDRLEKFINEI